MVIAGPTAGGKSALAVHLALALAARGQHAEIITADAFQVYCRMDVGTAKPTPAERHGIAHHLIDLLEPAEPFTLDYWLKLAQQTIDRCRARHVLPIVVGGTHLYIKALLDGLFDGPAADLALRAELAAMDPLARREMLIRVDPHAAARIHTNDLRRTVRALEVFRLTGVPISQHQQQWDRTTRGDALLVTLHWPVEAINPRINARVRAMLAHGLVEETASILAHGGFGPQAREALGYKQLLAFMQPHQLDAAREVALKPTSQALDHIAEEVKIATRRLAKSQRTWLRRLSITPGALPLHPDAALDPLHPGAAPLERWSDQIIAALNPPHGSSHPAANVAHPPTG